MIRAELDGGSELTQPDIRAPGQAGSIEYIGVDHFGAMTQRITNRPVPAASHGPGLRREHTAQIGRARG
jgi:hypothetical protein